MRVQSALFASASLATLAQNAAGFLITPSMKPSAPNTLDFSPLKQSAIINIDCQGCPFVKGDGSEVVDTGDAITKLHLEFETKNGHLTVVQPTYLILESGEKSAAVSFSGSGTWRATSHGAQSKTSHAGDWLSKQYFKVATVSDKHVNAQAVQFNLLSREGKLYIMGSNVFPLEKSNDFAVPVKITPIELFPADSVEATTPDELFPADPDSCAYSPNKKLCELRAKTRERFEEMMDAARGRASRVKGWMETHGPGNKARPCPGFRGHRGHPHKGMGEMGGQRHGGPHHGRPGHHGHRHHRPSRIIRWLVVITKTLIIPAALGMACGMLAAFVGMLVGRLITFLWIRLVRGGRRGTVQNIRVLEVEIEEGEKTGLMLASEDAPPAYQDEVIVVEETKETKQ